MAKIKEKNYSAPAVDRMLDIAEFLVDRQRPYGVSELSRELGISNNFVFRIMKRLVERGYAEFDPESGGYTLGSGFYNLGMRLCSRFDLHIQARDVLDKLSRKTGETAVLQVPDGDNMRVLDVVVTQTDFFLQIVPGLRVPYHCNSYGKCVLAFREEERLEEFLKNPLERRTPRTITDTEKLKQELDSVREEGIAYDREEHTLGIYCVGAPVFDVHGHVAGGLGISGLAGKHRERTDLSVEANVMAAAKELSEKMGYFGDFYSRREKAFA